MAQSFSPRLGILPPPQRRLWDELAEVPSEFVLYGGTALALHLGHRQSVDFDFFSDSPLDERQLVPAIPFLEAATVTQRAPNTLSCIVDRGGVVKVAFFGLPWLTHLAPPLVAPDNGLQVASLLDIAAKASVVQQRAEAKDYLDIAALLTSGVDLPTVLAAGRAVHGAQFNPQSTLKALSYFEDGNLRRLPEPVKDRLRQAVRDVDLDRLPALSATGRSGRHDRGGAS